MSPRAAAAGARSAPLMIKNDVEAPLPSCHVFDSFAFHLLVLEAQAMPLRSQRFSDNFVYHSVPLPPSPFNKFIFLNSTGAAVRWPPAHCLGLIADCANRMAAKFTCQRLQQALSKGASSWGWGVQTVRPGPPLALCPLAHPQALAAAAARRAAVCRCCVVSFVEGKVGMMAGSLGRGCSRNQGCFMASAQEMRRSCRQAGAQRGGARGRE
jgi:hypothetical protein